MVCLSGSNCLETNDNKETATDTSVVGILFLGSLTNCEKSEEIQVSLESLEFEVVVLPKEINFGRKGVTDMVLQHA